MWPLLALLLAQPPAGLCPAGWEALGDEACLLRGDQPGLVLYFHGMSAPSPRALAFELGFASSVSRARRVSFVSLRGTPGLCDWAGEYAGWWCWPTSRSRTGEVDTVISRAQTALALARQRLRRDDPTVIAGYSNGAYLVTLLMERSTLLPAGWVVMHGGPVTGVSWTRASERPTLLLAAAADAIQRPGMESLKARLDDLGWSSALVVRPGGHPPEVEDFQRLFDFAATTSREALGALQARNSP